MTAAEVVSKWFELYNDGTPDLYGGTGFLSLYADDFRWVEKPSQFSPEGGLAMRTRCEQESRMLRSSW